METKGEAAREEIIITSIITIILIIPATRPRRWCVVRASESEWIHPVVVAELDQVEVEEWCAATANTIG